MKTLKWEAQSNYQKGYKLNLILYMNFFVSYNMNIRQIINYISFLLIHLQICPRSYTSTCSYSMELKLKLTLTVVVLVLDICFHLFFGGFQLFLNIKALRFNLFLFRIKFERNINQSRKLKETRLVT